MQREFSFDYLPDAEEFRRELSELRPPFSVEVVQGERYILLDTDTANDLHDYLYQIENGIDRSKPFVLDIADADWSDEDDWRSHPALTAEQRNQ